MKNGYTPVREKVIRRNIDDIREYLISVQLEAEYAEICMKQLASSIEDTQEKINSLLNGEVVSEEVSSLSEGKNVSDEVSNLNAQLEKARESFNAFNNVLLEYRATEAGLISKLDFYKSKREEVKVKKEEKRVKRGQKFVEEGIKLFEAAPSKINVDMTNIEFKEGKMKDK